MPILLYCVAKADAPAADSLTGVAGDSVLRAEIGGLAVFASPNPDSSAWLRPALQSSALEFHSVLSKVFKSVAIIPFRFPTLFENQEQLIERVKERSSEYAALLEKFQDFVQMEIKVTSPDLATPAMSGTQYLKGRQTATRSIEKFTSELRTVLSTLSRDWRERPSKEGIRAFSLIDRSRTAEFRNVMTRLPVPHELTVRVSGPWPVSEFIEQS